VSGWFTAPCRKLYLIDEPEQRLHPALQRRAARWLSTAMRQWDCQAVIATHAIAFIDIPGNREVYELSRHGQQCEIQRIDPSRITPATPLARAVGFDRGELLARYGMFIVANLPLAALLDELVADRLEQARIKLVAVDLARPGNSGRSRSCVR
jgi:hypothetical protein